MKNSPLFQDDDDDDEDETLWSFDSPVAVGDAAPHPQGAPGEGLPATDLNHIIVPDGHHHHHHHHHQEKGMLN